MAICQWCKREMTRAVGCSIYKEKIGNKTYNRIKFGEEKDRWGEEGSRCGDCNCKWGHYHHPGCDIERCPICEGQSISCGCYEEEEED